jgi:hypothetical protein
LIKTFGLYPAKLFIVKVGIVNHLRNLPDLRIANGKMFAERLKRAVVPAVSESLRAKHVEWYGVRVVGWIVTEDKSRFGINESADQPG